MRLEIEKVKDGTFTSRGVAKNGKLIFANHDANTKQGAYKNLIADAKGWAELFDLQEVVVGKTPKKPELWIAFDTENVMRSLCFDVKEINC